MPIDGRCTLNESVSQLLNNPKFSDVCFQFADEDLTFYSHKFILSIRSSVFDTMFNGSIPEASIQATSNVVKIVDISSGAFYELLRFLYTDKVNLEIEHLNGIIHAAHKYDVKLLSKACAEFLEDQLTNENVIAYLKDLHVYGNESTEACLQFIDGNINSLICREILLTLDEIPLKEILIRNTLNIAEYDLFMFLLKWSKKSSVNLTIKEQKEKFMALFEQIRFPSMSVRAFSHSFKLEPTFFTDEETLSIFKYCSTHVAHNLTYSTVSRRNVCSTINFRKIGMFSKDDTIKKLTFALHEIVEIKHFCPSYYEGSVQRFVLKLYQAKIVEPLFSANVSSSIARIICRNKLVLQPNIKYTLYTETDGKLEYCSYEGIDYSSDSFNFSFPPVIGQTHIASINCITQRASKRKLET